MITIIDTRRNKAYVMECYTDAESIVRIPGYTLRRWELIKREKRQEPVERVNDYIIYFDSEIIKSKKGFASK